MEFYDYATPQGAAELANNPDDPRAQQMLSRLLNDLIPNELRARLPGGLGVAQDISKAAYLYIEEQALNPSTGESPRDLLAQLGYGRGF